MGIFCQKGVPAEKQNFYSIVKKLAGLCVALGISMASIAQDLSATRNNAVVSYLRKNFSGKISNVIVDKNNVTIRGTVSGSQNNLYLCELRMFDDTKLTYDAFDYAVPINQSAFEIKVKRFITIHDTGYDRIYSRWVIASKNGNKYQIASAAHYAEDIYRIALQYLPEKRPVNKKGIEGFFTKENVESDLLALGVKNVTVNITLPNWVSAAPTKYSYRLNNLTYYFDPKMVDYYDKAFKFCSDNNISVTAVLLIPRTVSGNLKSIFVYPGSTTGAQSMANLTSLTSFNFYVAAVSFVAQRYNKPDRGFGIQNWIVHNEVDNGYYYANAGDVKMEFYTDLYDRSLRTVYYTVRQFNPAAKVFLSLTHAWAATGNAKFFPPKNMLEVFNQLSKKQGDYEWGIAYHPYPEDAFNPKTWADKSATSDINSSRYISPKNIELIDQWICMKSHLYKGLKVRTLLFSEEGVHTKSNSKEDLAIQAAGIAYMWKKFNRLPTVEAFDYHAQADNKNEKGLKFGLWTAKLGTIATPNQKKPSWHIYQKAGTTLEDSAFAFALPIIGITDWSQVLPPLKEEAPPLKIVFNVTNAGQPANNISIYFNGEVHKTINGMATFYNVASLTTPRKFRLEQDGKPIKSEQQIVITKDQTISIDISR